jgi:hypothetical protein
MSVQLLKKSEVEFSPAQLRIVEVIAAESDDNKRPPPLNSKSRWRILLSLFEPHELRIHVAPHLPSKVVERVSINSFDHHWSSWR